MTMTSASLAARSEFAGVESQMTCRLALEQIAALIAAAVRQKTPQRHAAAAKLEHARAGGNELRGEFGARVVLGRFSLAARTSGRSDCSSARLLLT